MAQKGQAYYYVTNSTPRKWIPLGNDLHQARLKWAELERDLRAKAATDTEDLHHAQKLLGHTTRAMTEHYTRKRIGDTVKPVGTKPEKL